MKGPFGTTIGAHRFLGGGRLGEAISDDVLATLASTTDGAFATLRVARLSINRAAEQGFDTEAALASHDEIYASLSRLVTRLTTLDVADQPAWESEASRLFEQADALRVDLDEALSSETSRRMWKIGFWTGGGVLAAVGAVFWIRSRKKRRR